MAQKTPDSKMVTGERPGGEFYSQLADPLAAVVEKLQADIAAGNNKAQKEGLYGHSIRMKIGETIVRGRELDVEFTVPFDDDAVPDEAEIVVYNLSDTAISKMKPKKRKRTKCVIEAGYVDDIGVIFDGTVKKVKTRWVGADRKTTIYAVDDGGIRNAAKSSRVRLTYEEGVTSKTILSDLVRKSGLPVGTDLSKLKKYRTFDKSVTVDGDVMELLSKYAAMSGVQAYILKGRLYLKSYRDASRLSIPVTTATGMISSPEEIVLEESDETINEPPRSEDKDAPSWERPTKTFNGYKVQMLINHRVSTGVEIRLYGRNAKGRYTVRSGVHTYNGTEMTTEVEAYGK